MPLSGWRSSPLTVISGLAPGVSARATIDHCYNHPVGWEPKTTRCTRHWTRLGWTFTGRVYGVDVKDDRQAIPGAAQVKAVLVWTVRVVMLLVAAVCAVLMTRPVTPRALRQPTPR